MDNPSLANLHEQLADALASRDWDAMRRLNEAVGLYMRTHAGAASGSAEQHAERTRLQHLYRHLIAVSRSEHQRLRDLLTMHRQTAEGRSAYQQIDHQGH